MPPKRAIGADDGGAGRPSKKPKTAPANKARLRLAKQNRDKIKATSKTSNSTKTDRRQKEKRDKKSKANASAVEKQDSNQSHGKASAEKPSKLKVDTEKANEEQLQQLAPNSVGPPFTPFLTVSNDVQKLVRKNRQQGGSKPTGISNNSGNHCYRNAVLTMLLNSKPFVAYVSSTKDNEPDLPDSESRGQLLLRRLRHMAAAVDKGEPELQDRLDKTVKHFWKATCFPKETNNNQAQSQVSLRPWAAVQKAKDSVAEYPDSHEEDAAEFLGWMLETISQQLKHYQSVNGFDNTGRSSEQRSFDWLLSMSKAGRVVCSKCSWRVQRRIQTPREPLWFLALPESSSARDTKSASTFTTLVDLIQDDMHATLSGARCPRCNRKDADLERYDDIKQAPEILFICIARYKVREVRGKNGEDSSFTGVKDLDVVEIPEDLELSDFLNRHDYGEKSVVEYRLSGMISHSGQSATSGHYHSFVRGGRAREQWYRTNDSRVETCDLEDFNDSKANGMNSSKFKTRFTPYILMYEINPRKSKTTPGRAAQNVGEGDDKDERPTTWTGGDPREQTPGMAVPAPQSVVHTVPSPQPGPTTTTVGQQSTMPSVFTHLPGLESEADYPQARLDITVELGDEDDNRIKIEIPSRFITHFNRNKPRTEISIKATLIAPKAQTNSEQAASAVGAESVEFDLVDRLVKGEIEQYCQTEALNEAKKEWQSQGLQGNEFSKARSEFWNSWRKKWPIPDWISAWKDVDVPAGADVTDEADASAQHNTPRNSDASSDTIVIDVDNYEGMFSKSLGPAKTQHAKVPSQSTAAGSAINRLKKTAAVTKSASKSRSSSDKPALPTNEHLSKRQPSATAGKSPARDTVNGSTSTATRKASVKPADAKPTGVRKSERATRKPARFEDE